MKKDKELGLKVSNHLQCLGIETPMDDYYVKGKSNEERITIIASNIAEAMKVLNLDLQDDSLQDTPNRVAKMWVNEIFSGLDYANFPKITAIENKMNCNEMVLVKNITAHSSCEHHLILVSQIVHIAYIPDKKVIGLSKLARVAKFFAQRPEVQERFTSQVFETLKYILETNNVAVSVEGRHYCMIARGVEDSNATTITNKLGGSFQTDPATRSEFFMNIKG
jgi:GTP cyclohydrolase I